MRRRSRAAWADPSASAADEALVTQRLELLGLTGVEAVKTHENRTVLVSVAKNGVLHIHRGYAYASDRILRAVVTFVGLSTAARERKRAERTLVTFPVDEFVRPTRRLPVRERVRPGDRQLLRELRRRHTLLNRQHFDGQLSRIPIRLSSRMRTRLGELTVDPQTSLATEIAISRDHIVRDGWNEVMHTLLHEMVHQWQVESDLEVDHGETFRLRALEVGIVPGARRNVTPSPRGPVGVT